MAREKADKSHWEEDGNSQQEDRIKPMAQQEKYNTSCCEGSASSSWGDSIKTTAMEEEVLSQTSAKGDGTETTAQQGKYDTIHWEESVSSQLGDSIKTTAKDEEVLAQSRAKWEESGRQQQERDQTSSAGNKIKTTPQEKNYQTTCGKEDSPSHWMDRGKTTAREEEVLAQSRAKQENASQQRPAISRESTIS